MDNDLAQGYTPLWEDFVGAIRDIDKAKKQGKTEVDFVVGSNSSNMICLAKQLANLGFDITIKTNVNNNSLWFMFEIGWK